jgi:tetratricopeptide (TPR) repeat protein
MMIGLVLAVILLADPEAAVSSETPPSTKSQLEWFEDQPAKSEGAAGATNQPTLPSNNEWQEAENDFEADYQQVVATLGGDLNAEQRPALLLKAMMLASILKTKSLVDDHMAELIEQYPDSFETQYVLSNFPETSKLKDFVTTRYLWNLAKKGEAERAARVIHSLYKLHKHHLLKEPGFAANACLAALMADDRLVWSESRPGVNDVAGQVLDAAADETRSLSERFHQLETILKKRNDSRRWELLENAQFYLTQKMSTEEKEDISIRRIVAERLLDTNKLDPASEEYSSLVKLTDDPQVYAQYAMCLARQLRFEEALAQCRLAIDTDPDSAWRPVMEQLVQTIESQSKDQKNTIELLSEIVAAYRDTPLASCDIEVQINLQDGLVYTLNFAANFAATDGEFTVCRDGELLLGLRTTEAGTFLAQGADQPVRLLFKSHMIPDVFLEGARVDDTGRFRGNFQVSYSTSLSHIPITWRTLWRNNKLFSKAALLLMLNRYRGDGSFVKVSEAGNNQRTLEFTHFCADAPRVLKSSLLINDTQKVESAEVEFGRVVFRVNRFRVERRASQSVATGHWPSGSLDVAPTDEVSASEAAALVGQASAIFFGIYGEMMHKSGVSIGEAEADENTPLSKKKSAPEPEPWFSKKPSQSEDSSKSESSAEPFKIIRDILDRK